MGLPQYGQYNHLIEITAEGAQAIDEVFSQ